MPKPRTKSHNDTLYERAVEAIQALFGDSSVSQAETRRSLTALQSEIEIMKDTLRGTDDEG